mmetsp:Transcript_2089/g.3533  ORF Transcript_2089/g.3533 Transcript_2089/m.3533 type:complete len:259 (-) Transcript_2089:36-812(-)
MVQLDEAVLERLVGFIAEPRARACCHGWASALWETLKLEYLILVRRHIHRHGMLSYHHSAVRSLGDDFDESVAYQFAFKSDGTYEVSWNRSFGQWSAANERQVGLWRVVGDVFACESIKGPEVPEGHVKYAPAGRSFEMPVVDALSGSAAKTGTAPDTWEYGVRGAPVPEVIPQSASCADMYEAQSHLSGPSSQLEPTMAGRIVSDNARYVEVDGELHEVAADIRDLYPEEDWQRLMTCRVRFGIMGLTPQSVPATLA